MQRQLLQEMWTNLSVLYGEYIRIVGRVTLA